ncbi:MAG: potassium-transporting ATPase subunit KdpA [Planctomycetes bacterium]|nr:potassium-transporting ATPase subunit KdpA [Planctomycetota bacterium]
MTPLGWLQIVVVMTLLVLLGKPLGEFMARVYSGERTALDRVLGPVERGIYAVAGLRERGETDWRRYARAFVLFHLVGTLALYLLQRAQGLLWLDPDGLGTVSPDSSFNTAISFATNTNWQGYAGEATMSQLTQMLGLGVQNFASAASGMAVLAALARGFARRTSGTIGNFWVDLVRSTLYVLLPLSVLLALALLTQGVVQDFDAKAQVELLDPIVAADGTRTATQEIALGPVASQVAIKQLGTNGGGYYNSNSAHPIENPTPISNLFECFAILILGVAVCFTFGAMVRDRRQGIALLAAMFLLFLPALAVTYWAESSAPAALAQAHVDVLANEGQCGGNMEGKEVRFGIAASALWAAETTAASNGSVNSMHDSYTPIGGLVPMVLMQLGEVVFGGAGSGLYGMLLFAIVAVFLAGLMVGRTPEYLGKKIGIFEMKMASLAILVPCAVVLLGTAVAVVLPAGRSSLLNPGAHGFSEVLYAFSSAGNNNGSAFAGLNANTPFYNVALGLAMLAARFLVALPALAIAGALARKKLVPAGSGTLPTHGPLFIVLLCATVLLVGALTYLPALALGPIVEQLQMADG